LSPRPCPRPRLHETLDNKLNEEVNKRNIMLQWVIVYLLMNNLPFSTGVGIFPTGNSGLDILVGVITVCPIIVSSPRPHFVLLLLLQYIHETLDK